MNNKQRIVGSLDELGEYKHNAYSIQEAFQKLEEDLSIGSPAEAVRVHGKNILIIARRRILSDATKEYERSLRDGCVRELNFVKDRIEKLYT